MSTFAEITLSPGGILGWMAVGLLAGWLAGQAMSGGGYGVIAEMIVGLVGAVIGGVLLGALTTGEVGLLGSTAVAFVGACILIALVRFVAPEALGPDFHTHPAQQGNRVSRGTPGRRGTKGVPRESLFAPGWR